MNDDILDPLDDDILEQSKRKDSKFNTILRKVRIRAGVWFIMLAIVLFVLFLFGLFIDMMSIFMASSFIFLLGFIAFLKQDYLYFYEWNDEDLIIFTTKIFNFRKEVTIDTV